MAFYVNRDYKGTEIIPPLFERLDDLIIVNRKDVLQNMLRWVLVQMGHDADEIDQWIAKDEPVEVLAHHLSFFLKYLDGFDYKNLETVNKLITKCTTKL